MENQNGQFIDEQREAEMLGRAEKYFVSLQDVEKVYSKGGKVVCNFNLDVRKHEFIVIVGPSGCGKSTTLRMIGGLEDITSGNLFIDGEYSNYKPSKDRKMAMVFQSYALYPQMTVFENIAFPLKINVFPAVKNDPACLAAKQENACLEKLDQTLAVIRESKNTKLTGAKPVEYLMARLHVVRECAARLLKLPLVGDVAAEAAKIAAENKAFLNRKREEYAAEGLELRENGELYRDGQPYMVMEKLSKDEVSERVFSAARILDLGPYLDRLPRELSGGQMQRVALGRAIVKNVPLFLMDEPLSNLDAKLRLTMRSEIVKLHNSFGATTIYVTNDQTEAMTMATRVVVMSKGFIQQIDTPANIYNHSANLFVARFIGSPAINLFDAVYDGNSVQADECFRLPMSEAFRTAYRAFYERKVGEFENCIAGFDYPEKEMKSAEYIRKIESALADNSPAVLVKKQKKSLFSGLKEKFRKKPEALSFVRERDIAEQKLQALRSALTGNQQLILGIRPEHISVSLCGEEEKTGLTAKVTVCELLGAEYNLHFELFAKNFVVKVSSQNDYKAGDRLSISICEKDIIVFDPITGDRIN